MSEFGRTAHENGNRGTDHGHANCMFVMGGDVKGGKVYGKWPGLRARATLRRPRPGADHRFPRRPRRTGCAAQRQSVGARRVPGLRSEIPGTGRLAVAVDGHAEQVARVASQRDAVALPGVVAGQGPADASIGRRRTGLPPRSPVPRWRARECRART